MLLIFPKGPYQFQVYSRDADGNTSIKTTVFGNAYGDVFQSTLSPRIINSFSYNSTIKSATVTFKTQEELARVTEVKYTNLSGNEVVKTILGVDSSVILDQLDSSKLIQYRTSYAPTPLDAKKQETSIDLFFSNWKEYKFTAIKSVLESTILTPLNGGVNVSWNNPTNYPVKYTLAYTGGTTTISSSLSTDSKDAFGLASGSQTITVSLSDNYNNTITKDL